MLELADEKEKIKSVLKAMFPWLCLYRQQLGIKVRQSLNKKVNRTGKWDDRLTGHKHE